MLDYITKPTADAVTDLTNADEHLSVAETGDLTTGAGTFDIYVAIAGTVSVTTGGVLTAANDGDEAEFFYAGTPGGNIGINIASGFYAGNYTADYLGNPFTLADVQSAPVCLVLPTITGGTGNGATLTILPSLWIYDGPAIAPLTRQQKLNGVDIPIDEGGDEVTYLIDIAQVSGQSFTVAETFGGTTVTSAATTIDTFSGSWMAFDVGAKIHYEPSQIVLDGSNNVLSWPNNATGGGSAFDLTTVYGSQMPTWDVANSKLVGNGTNAGIATAATGDEFTRDGEAYSFFFVADAGSGKERTDCLLFSYGLNNNYVYLGLGQEGGILRLPFRDNGSPGGIGFGQDPPIVPINDPISAGKHLVELQVDALEPGAEARIFVDGRLEWSVAITEANSNGTTLSILSGGNGAWFSDAAIYEMFCTLSTGTIRENIRGELATKHSITLV